jgi:hypothetical protein
MNKQEKRILTAHISYWGIIALSFYLGEKFPSFLLYNMLLFAFGLIVIPLFLAGFTLFFAVWKKIEFGFILLGFLPIILSCLYLIFLVYAIIKKGL